MRQIKTVKELRSPARDLPAELVLTVDEHLSAEVADDLVRRGYAEEHEETDEGGEGKPLGKLKKPELVAVATALGVEKADDLTKAQLVEAIEAKRGEG